MENIFDDDLFDDDLFELQGDNSPFLPGTSNHGRHGLARLRRLLLMKKRYGPEQISNWNFATLGGGGDDVFTGLDESKNDGTIASATPLANFPKTASTHMCKMTAGTPTAPAIVYSLSGSTYGGKTFIFDIMFQVDATGHIHANMFDNTNYETIFENEISAGAANTPIRYQYTFTPTAGCVEIGFTIIALETNTKITSIAWVSLREVL